jgi:hypothetical protein
LAGKGQVVVRVGGVGPGRGGLWMWDGLLLYVVVPCAIAHGSGRTGHGSPRRVPVADDRDDKAVRPCRWRPVVPEAVKNCNKKTVGYDSESLFSEAHPLAKARLCMRLLFCEALDEVLCGGEHAARA